MIVVAEPAVLRRRQQQRALAQSLAGPGASHASLAETHIDSEPLEGLLAQGRLPVPFAGASWGHEASAVEGLVEAARTLAFDDGPDTL
ncbi:MAG: hypothetical protein ACREKB_07480, partial [Candidatus Rokuibacteriota bacterium]